LDIDNHEYEKAASILKALLWKKYLDLIKILEWNDIDKKVLVINRMKWIFATEEWVSNYNTLKTIVERRNEKVYKEKLFWPSWESLPAFSTDYRKAVLDNLSGQKNISQNVEEGLFGYTAFYRLWTGEWRRYSLTAPWATKVLWWEKILFDWDDQKLAKDWFINNFARDKASLSIIVKSINNQIPKSIGTVWMLSDANVLDLLSWKSLDIWDKILTLNSQCMFYLLWECANESIWIKINWFWIALKPKPWPWPEPEPHPPGSEVYSWELIPTNNYVWWIAVSGRSLSVPMVPWAYQHDVWINGSWPDKERQSNGNTNPWITPWDGTTPWIRSNGNSNPWIRP
jgi:hypothetical protein